MLNTRNVQKLDLPATGLRYLHMQHSFMDIRTHIHILSSLFSFAHAWAAPSFNTGLHDDVFFLPPSDRCFTRDVKCSCQRSIDSFVCSCLTIHEALVLKGGAGGGQCESCSSGLGFQWSHVCAAALKKVWFIWSTHIKSSRLSALRYP